MAYSALSGTFSVPGYHLQLPPARGVWPTVFSVALSLRRGIVKSPKPAFSRGPCARSMTYSALSGTISAQGYRLQLPPARGVCPTVHSVAHSLRRGIDISPRVGCPGTCYPQNTVGEALSGFNSFLQETKQNLESSEGSRPNPFSYNSRGISRESRGRVRPDRFLVGNVMELRCPGWIEIIKVPLRSGTLSFAFQVSSVLL